MVTSVTAETRAALRTIVARAFTDGLPPREAARLIRDVVGLTEAQATAVVHLRAELVASPGRLVRAGKVPIRVPPDGISATRLQRETARYAERLRRQRALLIARTEILKAANEGQSQLWDQAVQRGQLTGREVREVLVTADDRLCPICARMDGQQRGLGEPFTLPDGSRTMNPPFHPACRCTTGIVAVASRRAA